MAPRKKKGITKAPKGRAGTYLPQPGGYSAFHPKPLPPDPPLEVTGDIQLRLSEADRAIGRLDAATALLPNPDLFVAMYVRKEAVISSQIEGTQASLADLLEYEAVARRRPQRDVEEVVNYVAAMNYGLKRLEKLPLSSRLLREIHKLLLKDVRGADRNPGHFRRIQNWIGPPGATVQDAAYVPPPPNAVPKAMAELEKFLHASASVPPLIQCGLAHSQFETIHPFLDGNGRLGRLLITFLLCHADVLQRPLLYLSAYFKRYQSEYYDRLQAVRDNGDWEGWMRFFLAGVRSVSIDAVETARAIQELREKHRLLIGQNVGSATGHVLLDALFVRPYVDVNDVAGKIGRSYPVANSLVARFEELELLEEVTGAKRNRLFRYAPYLDLFGE